MMKLYKIITMFLTIFLICAASNAAAPVRMKDICKILEARDNQIMGFGLVVGLKNTGDSSQTEFTKIALGNLLNNMEVTSLTEKSFKSRNVAAVMITAELPPFLRVGQRVDVVVSSLGDARSLQGGTLLLTPLKGANGKMYAAAQGPIAVGGVSETSTDVSFSRNQTTVGRISGGAIVEKEVKINLGSEDFLTLVLNKPDFTTSARVAYAISDAGLAQAKASDASTVIVDLAEEDKDNLVDFIARLEEVKINPDTIAKVVVSERTGTVVIGENVKLTPVAVTHGNISVRIESDQLTNQKNIKFYEKKSNLITLKPGSNLSSLVNALNSVGTSPRDLIAILQAIKEAGALSAKLEII